MGENNLSSISKADTPEKMGEFWDAHDFTDFDTDTPDVEFKISCAVPIELNLFSSVEEQARLKAEVSKHIETTIGLLHRRVDAEDLGDVDRLHRATSSLVIESEVLDGIPTWPWQPATLRGLLSAV